MALSRCRRSAGPPWTTEFPIPYLQEDPATVLEEDSNAVPRRDSPSGGCHRGIARKKSAPRPSQAPESHRQIDDPGAKTPLRFSLAAEGRDGVRKSPHVFHVPINPVCTSQRFPGTKYRRMTPGPEHGFAINTNSPPNQPSPFPPPP